MRNLPLEVQLNEDIRQYTDKFIGIFTLRQCLFAGIALLLGAPVGFALWHWTASTLITMAGCAVVMLPIVVIGFVSWHGLPQEEHIKVWIRGNIMIPRFLPFQPDTPSCLANDNKKRKEHRK